jgi:hypothetical protein
LESQPSSRTEENPLYGMIGGIEETSASFEARYAPRSYPTAAEVGLGSYLTFAHSPSAALATFSQHCKNRTDSPQEHFCHDEGDNK